MNWGFILGIFIGVFAGTWLSLWLSDNYEKIVCRHRDWLLFYWGKRCSKCGKEKLIK